LTQLPPHIPIVRHVNKQAKKSTVSTGEALAEAAINRLNELLNNMRPEDIDRAKQFAKSRYAPSENSTPRPHNVLRQIVSTVIAEINPDAVANGTHTPLSQASSAIHFECVTCAHVYW
jgi:hypothetical protein